MARKKNENISQKTVEKDMTDECERQNSSSSNIDNKSSTDAKGDSKLNKDNDSDEDTTKIVENLNTELEGTNNKLVRLQADFLNYKNRTEKEKFSTYGNAVADTIEDLLPIIDNLERAVEAADHSDNEEVKSYNDGLKMIYDQFMTILQKRGLAEIEALNAKFDPNLHSGIAFEVCEDKEEDTIIEVFQKGYTVSEKVIRPSMVKISKK